MSLKIEFVERATQKGAKIAPLCREFGISRETGYKWLRRFGKDRDYSGLEERSRRPATMPTAAAEELVLAVLELREAHPSWGPKKLQPLLRRRYGERAPSRATIGRILERFGKVRKQRRRERMTIIERAPEVVAEAANDVWTIDFKGWWLARNGSRCEPLTVRDAYSRYVLLVQVMTPTMGAVQKALERLFRKHGVPAAIQCDNGTPFISAMARGGLTRLSAWWVSLGIRIVRSRPGCPQDNGGHERMHRDLSTDIEAMPLPSPRATQRALDRWRQEFNHVRPHEALGGKTPADFYKPRVRRQMRAQRFVYPPHWITRNVRCRGLIAIYGEEVTIGRALIGHSIGLEPLDGVSFRIWFGETDLGTLNLPPRPLEVDRACSRFLEKPFRKGKNAA